MKPLSEVCELLSAPQQIVITTHQNPDADALGSSLGLAHFLRNRGHQVIIISSTDFPPFLAWMNGASDIVIYEQEADKVRSILAASTMLWCLDFNIITRTKNLATELQNYPGTKVIIDHHLQPDSAYFDYGISQPEKSSTCEMIYDYIISENGLAEINQSMAECLYAGCMTDTGSFRFSGTSSDTHRMVANLLDKGVVPHLLHSQIFDTFPERRLKLLGHILCNCLSFFPEQNAALISLSNADSKQYLVQQGDTEGMVNYPLGVAGIQMSTFMHDKDGEIRISFRSKGDLDVNEFARKYFNGGGHKNAAGGKSDLPLAETITLFKQSLKEYINH
jgi:bifunctional oligoribonuclease and PAP phosphatase NrnA